MSTVLMILPTSLTGEVNLLLNNTYCKRGSKLVPQRDWRVCWVSFLDALGAAHN